MQALFAQLASARSSLAIEREALQHEATARAVDDAVAVGQRVTDLERGREHLEQELRDTQGRASLAVPS